VELSAEQLRDHGVPRGVELVRGPGTAPPGDTVGLLDQRDREPLRKRRLRDGDKVSRVDASACAVPEDEARARLPGETQGGPREAVRGVELERGQVASVGRATTRG
jgi:hypothetical protein